MHLTKLVLGPLQVNTYIVSQYNQCLIVDPGDCTTVLEHLSRISCSKTLLVVTHGHFDHTVGVDCIVRRVNAVLAAHPLEPKVAEVSAEIAIKLWNIKVAKQLAKPSIELMEGDILKIAGLELKVYHTPGHSPDHIVLYDSRLKIAFVGDLIFQGSIGRVDLPGSNLQDMVRSIARMKKELDPETRILPGHGPETVMRDELLYNPFIRDPGIIFE